MLSKTFDNKGLMVPLAISCFIHEIIWDLIVELFLFFILHILLKISKINELDAKTSTGDIKIDSLNGYVNIDSSTGDIKIEKANILENSKINNNVGDVKIQKINSIYVEGKTNVGDVKINKSDRHSEVELIITNNIGEIKVG